MTVEDTNYENEDIDDVKDDLDDDIEQRARAQGWRPEDEWDEERAEREGRKKPTKFYSAKEFLERSSGSIPILNERLRRMESENQKLRSSQKEFSSIIEDVRKQHHQALERVREQTRKEVEERMNRAAAEGDMDAHKAAVSDLKNIEKQEREALLSEAKAKSAAPSEQDDDADNSPRNPEIDTWVERNKGWFRDAERVHLNAYMISQHKKIKAGNPDMPEIDALERAKRMTMTKFPEEFGGAAVQRRGSPTLEGNSMGNSRGGSGQSVDERFNALPRDAKDAYESARQRMARLIPPRVFTKEQYLKDYGA
jgi:hypothetical protein